MAELELDYTRSDKDANGNVRWYYVREGQAKVRLNPRGVEIGSEEFFNRYELAKKGKLKGKPKRRKLKKQTLGWLIEEYITSPEFTSLATNTQNAKRRILLKVQAENGSLPMEITSRTVRNSRRKRAATPAAANEFVKILSAMYNWAMGEELVTANPASGIKRLKEGESHRPWTKEEINQYREKWPLGTRERLAFELLYQTAQRIGDVALMGPQHIAGNDIRVKQQKTGAKLVIPVTLELADALRGYQPKGLKFLGYSNGASLGNAFLKWKREAGLPEECKAHGLRATRATDLANEGKTAHQIMAITGHKTLQEAQRYTQGADQERLAREAFAEQTVPSFNPKSKLGR